MQVSSMSTRTKMAQYESQSLKICYSFGPIYIFDMKIRSERQCFKMEVYIFYLLLAYCQCLLAMM